MNDSRYTEEEMVAAESTPSTTIDVLVEVAVERGRQESRWGQQDHPWSTDETVGFWARCSSARTAKEWVDAAASNGNLTFAGILAEEFYEAIEEHDIDKAREELIQVAAVAVAAIESIDRNRA